MMLWQARLDKLPIKSTLFGRGCAADSQYPVCRQVEDSSLHELRDCDRVFEVWKKVVEPRDWDTFKGSSNVVT